MGTRIGSWLGVGAWGPLLALLAGCAADGHRSRPSDHRLEEPVATRWPDLPAVELSPRPPTPAGPEEPDPRWELLYELAHPDPVVRLEAVERSVAHAKDPLVRERLLELFDDPDPAVAADAIATLGTDDREVRERLFVVMRDRRGLPRRVAAQRLIESGGLRGRWYAFARSALYGPEQVLYLR